MSGPWAGWVYQPVTRRRRLKWWLRRKWRKLRPIDESRFYE